MIDFGIFYRAPSERLLAAAFFCGDCLPVQTGLLFCLN
jgi:hypothetical protein